MLVENLAQSKQAWQVTFIILTLVRLSQENHELEASLGHTSKTHSQTNIIHIYFYLPEKMMKHQLDNCHYHTTAMAKLPQLTPSCSKILLIFYTHSLNLKTQEKSNKDDSFTEIYSVCLKTCGALYACLRNKI